MDNEKINLRALFTTLYDDLPEMVDSKNCVYKITNLINGKAYIGQAKWLFGRFVGPGFTHQDSVKWCETYLYRSIRKYKSRNFTVEILEKDIPIEDLGYREIYWIAHYKTYYESGKGYNLNTGGGNCEQLHTEEARAKAMETRIRDWSFHSEQLHTPEAYEKNRRNHGGVLSFNTPEAIRKSKETQIEKYGCLAFHTERARALALASNRRNHNGNLALHTPEVFASRLLLFISQHLLEGLEVNKNHNLGLTNLFDIYLCHYDDCDYSKLKRTIKRIFYRYDDIDRVEKLYFEDSIFHEIFDGIIIKDNLEQTLENVKEAWINLQ